MLGVSQGILRTWADEGKIQSIRTPGGQRLFDISEIKGQIIQSAKKEQTIVLYSRVSSSKQRNDLERQQKFLRDSLLDKHSGKYREISDIGSGINFKRPGLLRVLGLIKDGLVSKLIVASKDRIARFGYDLIGWFCAQYGTQIIILDNQDGAPEEELGKDLMSIVQIYCCRWNGQRRYKFGKTNEQSKNIEIENTSIEGAKTQTFSDGGMLPIHIQQSSINDPEERFDTEGCLSYSRQDCNTEVKRDPEQLLQQQEMAIGGVPKECKTKRSRKRNSQCEGVF